MLLGASAYAVVMSAPAQSAPAKNTGSFASLLASFTGAAEKENDEWDLSGLADDVATISYEEALRSCRPARLSNFTTEEAPRNSSSAGAVARTSNRAIPREKKRKTASITLRLTEDEQAQLQERSSAAKLSVSAYIRSCIFEAESLRAQVKEALAQMQPASQPASSTGSTEKVSRNWRKRFFPGWSRHPEN